MLEGLIERKVTCGFCGEELEVFDESYEVDKTGLTRICKGTCPKCKDVFVWKENYAYCGLSYYDTLYAFLGGKSKGLEITQWQDQKLLKYAEH